MAVMALQPAVTVKAVAEKAEVMNLNNFLLGLIITVLHLHRFCNAANLEYFCQVMKPNMKRIAIHIVLCLIFTAAATGTVSAQQTNFDADIHAIRNNAMPDFRFKYDDYMQYAPAGVMLVMKACTYESRSSWGRMLVSDAFSTAVMAAAVNGLKYTVQRPRPDGSRNNSFPSGHTATSFMTATMLHMEYGWRSPWFSIGAYTVATASGVSRILNNKHWMTDIIGGAAVGIGAVHLGYYLTDLIFKEKGLASAFERPVFDYDFSAKHYVAELSFGHRHFFGGKSGGGSDFGASFGPGDAVPKRGGVVSLSTDIPIIPGVGIKVRGSAGSLIFKNEQPSTNMYSTTAGGYWNFFYAKRFEFQAQASAGAAWGKDYIGADISAGLGVSFLLDSNFKLKLFADYETFSWSHADKWLHSVVLGWSSAWFW